MFCAAVLLFLCSTFSSLLFVNATDATNARIDIDWNTAINNDNDDSLTGRTNAGNATGGRVVATASIEFGSSLLELEELSFQGLPVTINTINTSSTEDSAVTEEFLSGLTTFRKVKTIVKGGASTSTAGFQLMSEIIWHGVEWNDETNNATSAGFATIVQNTTTGDLCGTLTTRTTTYALLTTAFGELQVRAVPWKDHYRDDDDNDDDDDDGAIALNPRSNSPLPTQDDSVSFQPSPSSQITSLLVSKGPAYNVTTQSTNNNNRMRKRQLPKGRDDEDEIISIDILVVVSNRAMCEYAGFAAGCSPLFSVYTQPILQKISLLQAEFNNAMDLNKIKNVQVNIVDIRLLPATNGFPENEIYTTTELLSYMATDTNIQNWRNQAYADAVTMIASADPERQACGRAQLGGTHAVTSYECLESYSWTHEVGHLLGCRHNREDVPNPDAHPYGFGYRKSGKFRTVMSYSCLDDGDAEECPRIPVFSDSDVDYRPYGKLGDVEHDNARLIRETAPALATQLQIPTSPPTPAPTKFSSRDDKGGGGSSATEPPVNDSPSQSNLYCGIDETDTCRANANLMHGNIFGFVCISGCLGQGWVWLVMIFGWDCGVC